MNDRVRNSWWASHLRGLIAAGLAILAFLALFFHAPRVGYTRDEGFYFSAAKSYAGWFKQLANKPDQALKEPTIRRYYENNREHPVLLKNLMALSYLAFSEQPPQPPKDWPASESPNYVRSMRLPAQLFSALAVALVFLLGSALASVRVGLLAALMFFMVPRHFYHAQLACFDMPAVTVWLATIMAYRKSRKSIGWAIACGAIWGIALATKHNSFFIPVVLVGHWLITSGNMLSLSRGGLRLPRIPTAFFAMLILGPLVFIGHWPFLWHQTLERIGWYFGFHLHHVHYPWEYFGTLLREPPFPWLYPFAVSAVTCPLPTLFLGCLGFSAASGRLLGRPIKTSLRLLGRISGLSPSNRDPTPVHNSSAEKKSDTWLLVLNAFIPFALIAMPSVPIFGGIKHWMHAMPFVCILGALALERMLDHLPRQIGRLRLARKPIFATLGGLVLLPALLGMFHVGGYGTSQYNSLIGGISGAADAGMQRQYWSNNITGVLPWLNENLPQNARVHFQELTGDSYQAYRIEGLLRPDLRMSWVLEHSDYTVYQYHREFADAEYLNWNIAGNRKILHGLYLDEVPIILVYGTRKQ